MFHDRPLLMKYCYYLIGITILINAGGLFSPVLNSNDAYFYAVISKNILNSHNWIDLVYNGQDWLDKPHLPFWLTSVSFKLLGSNAFAYVLPGFFFHLIGAAYTYALAKKLYNHETGILATLIYLSSLHLLLSSMDVRAEAYLLGEIMPACYYWLSYERSANLRALVLASIFTALAMMTKGLFVVITIFSGLVFSWFYRGQYFEFIRPKWLVAYALCLVFALPELICLYLQFDAHPDKIIFGHTHVSGLAWYFWGSQFGRFFNNGPIVNTHGNPFFFLHTYLWAFLPWSLVFIGASYAAIREFKTQLAADKLKIIYLLASFWLTFGLFSATKFQLDHYTNIIMPFAAILCANYLLTRAKLRGLALLQSGVALLLLVITIGLASYLFGLSSAGMIIIPALLSVGIILKTPKLASLLQIIVYSVLSIGCAFMFLMLVNAKIYPQYSIGYQVTQVTNQQTAKQQVFFESSICSEQTLAAKLPLYSYQVDGAINSLNFHGLSNAVELNDLTQLNSNYYLLIKTQDLPQLKFNGEVTSVANFNGLAQEKFIPALLSAKKYQQSVQKLSLLGICNQQPCTTR